jgi:uncharacterized membrane protein
MQSSGETVAFDPIRLCVYTTIALLAWIVSAPVMMMAMSALGLVGYARAMRAGLTRSKCVLRRPRLVLLYLGTVFAAGATAIVVRFVR